MKVGRDWIQAHIPHQGNMCLLHAVDRWDNTEIVCVATGHTAPDHPLRNATGLPIVAGIEYAAQSMAVHGALLATSDETPEVGYLTSVRNVQWWTPRLDDLGAELCIQATRISGNDVSLLYNFALHCSGRLLLCGRASVMIKPSAASGTLPPNP